MMIYSNEYFKELIIPRNMYDQSEIPLEKPLEYNTPVKRYKENATTTGNTENKSSVVSLSSRSSVEEYPPEIKTPNVVSTSIQIAPTITTNTINIIKRVGYQVQFSFNMEPTIRGLMTTKDLSSSAIKETANMARAITYPFLEAGIRLSTKEEQILKNGLSKKEFELVVSAMQSNNVEQMQKCFSQMLLRRKVINPNSSRIAKGASAKISVNNMTKIFPHKEITQTDKILLNKLNMTYAVSAQRTHMAGYTIVPLLAMQIGRYLSEEETIGAFIRSARYANMVSSFAKSSLKFTKYSARITKLAATKSMEMLMKTKLGKKLKETSIGKKAGETKSAVSETLKKINTPAKKARETVSQKAPFLKRGYLKNKIKRKVRKQIRKTATKLFGERFVSTFSQALAKATTAISSFVGYIAAAIGIIVLIVILIFVMLTLISAFARKINLGSYTDKQSYGIGDEKSKTYIEQIGDDLKERYDIYEQSIQGMVTDWSNDGYTVNITATDKKSNRYDEYNSASLEDNTILKETTNLGEILIMTYACFDYDINKSNVDEASDYAVQLFNGSHELKATTDGGTRKTVTIDCITYYFDDLYECKLNTAPEWEQYAGDYGTTDGNGCQDFQVAKSTSKLTEKVYAILDTMGLPDNTKAAVVSCWEHESHSIPATIESNCEPAENIKTVEDLHNYTMKYNPNGGAHNINYSYGGYQLCGIGYAQWTASRAYGLIKYSEKHKINGEKRYWYDLDVQISFMLAGPEGGGDSSSFYNSLDKNENATMEEALMKFFPWEGGGNWKQYADKWKQYNDRKNYLPKALKTVQNLEVSQKNKEYAESMLKMSGFKKNSKGQWRK